MNCLSEWCKDCVHNDGDGICSLHTGIILSVIYVDKSLNKKKYNYCIDYLQHIRKEKLKRIIND